MSMNDKALADVFPKLYYVSVSSLESVSVQSRSPNMLIQWKM